MNLCCSIILWEQIQFIAALQNEVAYVLEQVFEKHFSEEFDKTITCTLSNFFSGVL